jgi:hypothetical protein
MEKIQVESLTHVYPDTLKALSHCRSFIHIRHDKEKDKCKSTRSNKQREASARQNLVFPYIYMEERNKYLQSRILNL